MTLEKLTVWIKDKSIWVIFIVLILIGALVTYVFIQNKPTPIYKNLTLGKATQTQVKQTLGEPVKSQTKEPYEIYGYKSSVPNRLNEVWLKNQVVVLIKEQISDKKKDYYLINLGLPKKAKVFYSTNFSEAQELLVYSNYGYALVVNKNDNSVFEVWYFKPRGLSSFVNDFGKDLTTQQTNNFN